jgi:quinoprotein glucose dehydrogenase
MIAFECDVCIVGGGVTAAMFAAKLSELRPEWSIVLVEAGRTFNPEQRRAARRRLLRHGEDPWPGDAVDGYAASGSLLRTMAVGGSSLQWGATCNRFSEEDLRLRSRYGIAVDWPIDWPELETFYCEAERRLGVAGEESPYVEDRRSEPYPMPPLSLTPSLTRLKTWAESIDARFQAAPQAKNTVAGYDGRPACTRCGTCSICPTGAKYSADFTIARLLEAKRVGVHDRTIVRRLVHDPASGDIVEAIGTRLSQPNDTVTYRARVFVVAAGTVWSPHLLLASRSTVCPDGVANSSGLVGRYMTGHVMITATVELNFRVVPESPEVGIQSRQYFRAPADRPYVRHDLRVGEHPNPIQIPLTDRAGRLLTGDERLAAARRALERGRAVLRAYCDVHPSRESGLTYDGATATATGDPVPTVRHRLDDASVARAPHVRRQLRELFERMCRSGGGAILAMSESPPVYHQAGGCRMGVDPRESVCDSFGRTHDVRNLYVIGAPTLPSPGCTNGTLTFVALSLRSAADVARFS